MSTPPNLITLERYLAECEADKGRKFTQTPGRSTGILCPCGKGELLAFICVPGPSYEQTDVFCRECGESRKIPKVFFTQTQTVVDPKVEGKRWDPSVAVFGISAVAAIAIILVKVFLLS